MSTQPNIGEIIEGKITGITKFGVFVEIGDGVTGMVHISEVARTYVSEIRDFVKEGDSVKVKVLSINEEGIDRLVLDLYDHFEKINSILNQINDLIYDSKNYFNCPANDELVKQYSEMKLNIDNFKDNVSSYSTDLIKVKNKFRQKSSELSATVMQQVTKIQSDVK